MQKFNISNAAVIFDLDDTLYFEASYVNSGIQHVCAQVKKLYGIDTYDDVQAALAEDKKLDWLSFVCELTGLTSSVKESLLWMYRLHLPEISLSSVCKKSLHLILSKAYFTGVLTDGRSVTQRLKLSALGLSNLPVYISEDYGSTKPDPARFKLIQEQHPAQFYIYVADNIQKDFLGCNPLGWISIGMRGTSQNLYSQEPKDHSAASQPAFWVNSWEELAELLVNNTIHPYHPHQT